ncbi:MAG: hypothetical protein R2857_11040 [Vampirovibrionales bacterium]
MINLGNHIIMDWNELRTFRGAQLVLLQQWNLNAAGGDRTESSNASTSNNPFFTRPLAAWCITTTRWPTPFWPRTT